MKVMTEPSPRLNELQRQRLWEDLLLAEARSYYFGDLATKYNREQRVITWTSLILSSSAMVTAVAASVANGQAWLPAVLALIASGVTFYSLVVQNHKRAADAADLHTRWAKLARAYERLWEEMYDEDALARLNAIEDSDPELSKPAVGLPWDRKRMRRWQEHVEYRHSSVT
jgi:hypothetical protein